jgi:hypothetical protein
MGGSIRVVTKIDGTIHKQIRWTNYLPDFVPYPEFISCNKEYIQAYINRANPEQEEVQTISPYGYGLDVFDIDAKKLWTMQGYCSYITIDTVLLSMWYNGNMIDGGKPYDESSPDYYPTFVQKMWDAGYIKVRGYSGTKDEPWDSAKEYFLTKNEVGLSMEECYAIMSKNWEVSHKSMAEYFEKLLNSIFGKKAEQPQLLNFVIDWAAAGWTIKEYDETSKESYIAYMQELEDAGFLTEDDKKAWEEWGFERFED